MRLCIILTNVEGSLYLGNNNNNKIKTRKGFLEDCSQHESGRHFEAAGSEVVMSMKAFQKFCPCS